MTTQTNVSPTNTTTPLVLSYKRQARGTKQQWGVSELSSITTEMFRWENLSPSAPLVHMLQPDYYAVFHFAASATPVYQQNLRLDLGPVDVRYETIVNHMHSGDLSHLKKIDHVMEQFTVECRLQPFDYICAVITRWYSPEVGQRYFMRKTTVLQCDARGIPTYGLMTIQDITALVSAIKPKNADVTFMPEKANLSYELVRRINAAIPKTCSLTIREKEIVQCLYKGMSSKEIASHLFISKATVDTHRQNLIRKWEVSNTAGLLKRAMEEGCI